jgi:hypothetical protein
MSQFSLTEEEKVEDRPTEVPVNTDNDFGTNPEFSDEIHEPEPLNEGERVETVPDFPPTVEEAVKTGAFTLDSKGRMPGIYLDDVEEAARQDLSERLEKLHAEADGSVTVQREINVASSPLPPMQVVDVVEKGDDLRDNSQKSEVVDDS